MGYPGWLCKKRKRRKTKTKREKENEKPEGAEDVKT
jgi:hypothetical protein